MPINTVPNMNLPARRAFSSIQPFTYSDAWTHLMLLERLRAYIEDVLTPGINEALEEFGVEFDDKLAATLANVQTQLAAALAEVDTKLNDQTAYVDSEIDALTTLVNDAVQEVINNSIELQDVVAAAIVEDETSGTRTVLDGLYGGQPNGVFQLSALAPSGLIEDRIMSAVNVVPDGSLIVVPVGDYSVVKSIKLEALDKSVSIDATGSTFTREGDFHFLDVNGIWSEPVNVTGLSVIDNNGTNATQIIIDAPLATSEGTIVKVYSDDPIGDVRQPNDTRFQGEMVEVLSTTENGLILKGKLFDAYSTNVRVSALAPSSFTWRGGLFKGGSSRGSVVRYNSLYCPELSLDVEGSGTIGFTMRSCYHPLIENCRVSDLMNDTSTEPYRLGYAVHDSGSKGLVFRNSDVYRSRHAYTDDVSNAASDDPASFGRPMYATIENVRAYGMKAGSFSPHHGGVGHRFVNCVSENGQNTGFSMRGLNHVVDSCVVVGGQASFTTFVEGGGSTYGCIFTDCLAYGGTSAGFSDLAELDRVPGNSYGMTIVNGYVEGAPRAVSSIRTRTRIDGLRYVAPAVLPDSATAIVSSNGVIDSAGTIDLDYRGNSSGDALVVATNAGVSARLRAETIRVRSVALGARFDTLYGAGAGSSGSALFNVNSTVVDEWPTVTHRSLSAETIAPVRTNTFTRKSGVIERTDVGITAIDSPTYSPDDITVLCNMTANVTRVLGSPRPGMYTGQRMTVTCIQTGTATTSGVDIQNTGLFRTIGELTYRLLNRQSALFVWDGERWVMTASTGTAS